MKITIEIGGNDYTFEMNRTVYKNLLADEEYSKMQNEITKRLKDKKAVKGNTDKAVAEIQEEMLDEDISALILRNMVMEEQIFYYSLLINQPDITIEKASALLDEAIAEYGSEEVSGLTTKLIENFTQRGDEPKKKMKMRIS
jgi:hypothetical protein